MNPLERRVAKLEEKHQPTRSEGHRVRFWESPEGMTDLAEQEAWLKAAIAADPDTSTSPVIHVHFVRCPYRDLPVPDQQVVH